MISEEKHDCGKGTAGREHEGQASGHSRDYGGGWPWLQRWLAGVREVGSQG